jgi:hypothetical protein
VLPLLAVSAAECVDALLLAGFAVVERTDDSTVLRRDLRVVAIRDSQLLGAEALEALLRAAGVPYTEFLDRLAETPTEPAFRVTETGVRARVLVDETG